MLRQPPTIDSRKNGRVALMSAGIAAGMLGLAFASVPLYRLFCQVTGFGGATVRAEAAPATVSDRTITIRFDSNTSSELPWRFHAEKTVIKVRLGEQSMAFYRAENTSSEPSTGQASYNVTPEIAGAYFNKMQCFCFNEQTLKAGEKVDMPVVFFVDPAILDDADARNISEITLSYTFYPVKPSEAAAKQLSN